MSNEADDQAAENKANGQSPAEAEAPAAEAQSASAPPPASGPVESKPDAQAEAARLRDQLLRTAADFDNFRKRSRREQEDATRRGREGVVKDLLPVFDNLERAAAHAETAPDAKAVADGIRMVVKQFVDTLDRIGIKRVATVGLPFDPSVHEAIQHLESKDQPAGTILVEVQPGYQIGEYLLRPAMVVVSKGPPAESTAN